MLKLLHRIVELALVLLILYFISSRALIYWLETEPEHVTSLINEYTEAQVGYQSIEIQSSWLGFEGQIKGLKVAHKKLKLDLDEAKFDINLLGLIVPTLSVGEELVFKNGGVEVEYQPSSESTSWQLNDLPFQKAHRFPFQLQSLWKKTTIDNLLIRYRRNDQSAPLDLHIRNFQLLKSSQINLVSEFGLYLEDVFDNETFSLKASLLSNAIGGVEVGDVTLVSYDPIQVENLAQLLPEVWHPVIPKGELLLEANMQVSQSRVSQMQLILNSQSLKWQRPEVGLPNSLGFELLWSGQRQNIQREFSDWRFKLSKMQIDNQFLDEIAPIELYFDQQSLLHFQAERFDMEPFKVMVKALSYHPSVARFFDQTVQLNLSQLKGVFDWQTFELPQLSFNLNRLSLPLTDYPSLAAIGVRFNKQDSMVTLKTPEPIWLYAPAINAKPFSMQFAKEWQMIELVDGWQLLPLRLSLGQLNLSLSGEVNEQLALSSAFSLETGDVKNLLPYLPYGAMSPKLATWLQDSLTGSEALRLEGTFAGELLNLDEETVWQSLKMQGDLKQASLRFNSAWPELNRFDGRLELENAELTVRSKQVWLDKVNRAQDVVVSAKGLNTKNIALEISAESEGQAQAMLGYLKQTPLIAKAGLEDWLADNERLTGAMALKLNRIWVPVYGFDKQSEQVDGYADIKKGRLKLSDSLYVDQASGRLHFTESTLEAKDLTGEFLQGPVEVDLSKKSQKAPVEIRAKGAMLQTPNPFVESELPWRANISVLEEQVDVEAILDTQAIQSKMPMPFNSAALMQQPMTLTALIGENTLSADFEQPNFVSGRIYIPDLQEPALRDFQLRLAQSLDDDLTAQGFQVKGRINQFDLDDWQQWWSESGIQQLLPETSAELPAPNWLSSHINIGNLIVAGEPIGESAVIWQTNSEQRLNATLVNDDMDIEWVAANEAKSNDLTIRRLNWQSSAAEDESNRVDETAKASTCDGSSLFESNWSVRAKDLQFKEYEVSELFTDILMTESGYKAQSLKGSLQNGAGDFTGSYRFDQTSQRSDLEIQLESKNTEALSLFMGVKRGLKKGSAAIKANLFWQGDIQCAKLPNIKGDILFNIKDGVIEDVEPGIARLLGLLSIESLARRLTLDLKDVTNKGLLYDQIKGRVSLEEGELTFKQFLLNAPSVKVTLEGKVDLINEQFNLEALVVPAVGSTIPTIAALAGATNPLAALAVYTFMKIIPGINEELISYRYQVTGAFDNPEMKLIKQQVIEK